MMIEKPTIVFIISHGHSGSTVLDKVIGNHKDGFSAGELLHYSRLYDSDKVFCGCSRHYIVCPFWQDVTKELVNSEHISNKDLSHLFNTYFIMVLRKSWLTDSLRLLLGYLGVSSFLKEEHTKAIENTGHLYDVLFRKTKAKYIVDSGKSADRAFFLSRVLKDTYDFKFIHLIRDGRAVLGSFHRKEIVFNLKGEDGTIEHKKKKRKVNPRRIVWSWILRNIYSSFFLWTTPSRNKARILYEDFTRSPDEIIKNLIHKFGLPQDGNRTALAGSENHMMGGHAARVNATEVRNSKPTWKEKVPSGMQRYFSRYAGWLNKFYGY